MTGKIVKFLILYASIFGAFSAKTFAHPIYLSHTDKISANFIKEMEEKYSLFLIATGGSMPYDVESIAIDFIAFRKGSIEEARVLLVLLTEKLVKLIHENDKVRPYLREYPFPIYRAQISIAFLQDDGRRWKDGSIAHAFQCKNTIFYYAESENSKVSLKIKEEPFLEALEQFESSWQFLCTRKVSPEELCTRHTKLKDGIIEEEALIENSTKDREKYRS